MSNVAEAYNQLLERWLNHHKTLPFIPFDDAWQSVCLQTDSLTDVDGEPHMRWQPLINSQPGQFDNIEEALEMSLHQDIKDYFTSIYSESLEAQCDDGKLSLLFAWNEDDFQRLQENIIGHILMKQRLKQPITVFFAVTDEEDMIISFDNDSGEVWVEQVGRKPHKKLTNSIVEFINILEPLA